MTNCGPEWKRGLPPGKYYDGMTADFEATLTVAGGWYHRRRTPEEREAYLASRPDVRPRDDADGETSREKSE